VVGVAQPDGCSSASIWRGRRASDDLEPSMAENEVVLCGRRASATARLQKQPSVAECGPPATMKEDPHGAHACGVDATLSLAATWICMAGRRPTPPTPSSTTGARIWGAEEDGSSPAHLLRGRPLLFFSGGSLDRFGVVGHRRRCELPSFLLERQLVGPFLPSFSSSRRRARHDLRTPAGGNCPSHYATASATLLEALLLCKSHLRVCH
jgi:hypothetical protein